MGEYTVCISGNKLVVAGWSDGAIRLAASELTGKISGGLTVFGTVADTVTNVYNTMLDKLPTYTDGEFAAFENVGNHAYQLVSEKTSVEAWSAYCTKLADAGYTLDSTREAAGNQFAIYRR